MSALYINGRKAVEVRIILKEMGHPQPPMPVQTDNSTEEGIIIFQDPQKWHHHLQKWQSLDVLAHSFLNLPKLKRIPFVFHSAHTGNPPSRNSYLAMVSNMRPLPTPLSCVWPYLSQFWAKI
jgi:hypothetical protein